MKAVLVIADSLQRSQLASLLALDPGVDVAATFGSGRQALRYLEEAPADLVFLDTGLPDLDPVAFAQQASPDGRLAIALVSQSDEDALLSFETHAVDYLIQPVTRARLLKTFARVKARAGRDGSTVRRDVIAIDPARTKISSEQRMAFRSKGKVTFLRLDEIRYITAEGNYLRVHARGSEYRFRDTMSNIEMRLDARIFLRIHRSTIVNLQHMKEIRNLPAGDAVVVLNDGSTLGISRTYRDLVYSHFGQDLVG
jgi:two-component system, LytTR family, response regulator